MTVSISQDRFNRLARRLQAGDRKAGEVIFTYLGPKVYRYYMARLMNRETAEDLTQEVFLRVVSKIRSFEEARGYFVAWLWQIVRNALKDFYREKKTLPFSALGYDETPEIADERHQFSAEVKSRTDQLMAEVKRLTPAEQDLFNLYFVSEMSYKELSVVLGKPEGTLRVLIHRLIKKLKGKIHD